MNFKKILALVLVLAMLVSMVPTYAFADDVELWDEGDYAVQNDAPLEDEYIDEDPVVYDPVPEEPAATDIEEPAAEEPVAEEPAAEEIPAAQTNETAALTAGETLEFNADDPTATIGPNKYDTLQEAINAAADNDYIQLRKNTTEDIRINKTLTIEALSGAAINGGISMTAGTVTLVNVTVTSILVEGGVLTIDEDDGGTYGTVQAISSVNSGAVKGGTFTKIPSVLLAEGYYGKGSYTSGNLTIGETTKGKVMPIDKIATFEAMVTTPTQVVYYATLAGTKGALVAALNNSGTLKILVDPGTYAYAWNPGKYDKTLTLDKSGYDLSIEFRDGEFCVLKTEDKGNNIVTYSVELAVASYVNAKGETVNTTTFKEAAEEAAKLTEEGKSINVTLYRLPDTTKGDVYEMGIGTLKVATGTDITSWDATYAETIVDVEDDTVYNGVQFSDNKTATYTVGKAVASVTVEGKDPIYYSTLLTPKGAIVAAFNSFNNKGTLKLLEPAPEGYVYEWAQNKYTKTLKIDASGYELPMAIKEGQPYILKNDEGTDVVTWSVTPAVASYVNAEEKIVYTETFNEAATEAKKLAKEDEAFHVTLHQLPDTEAGDIYEMGIGTLVVATGTDVSEGKDLTTKWDRDAAESIVNVVAEADYDGVYFQKGVATYKVTGAVASVTVDGQEPVYYDNLRSATGAIVAAFYNGGTLKLLEPVEEGYVYKWAQNKYNRTLKIDASGYELPMAINDGEPYILKNDEGTSVVTWSAEKAVASYYDDEKEKFVFTATFNEAATNAFAQAEEGDVVAVTLYQQPNVEDGDIYNMGIGTLTVATATDLGETTWWDNAVAESIVNVDGDVVYRGVDFNDEDRTATYEVTAAVASVTVDGEKPVYYDNLRTPSGAIVSAFNNGGTLKLFEPVPEDYAYEWAQNKYTKHLKIDASGYELPMAIKDGEPYILKNDEGTDVVEWYVVHAVASYVNDEGEIVYTETFNEAATNAFALAEEGEEVNVTLYQLPDTEEGDIYNMGIGTLVVATATDLEDTTWWDKDAAESIVKIEGDVDYDGVDFSDEDGTATYTVTAAVATVTSGDETVGYDTFAAAIAAAFTNEGTLKLLVAAPESYTYTWTGTDYAKSLKISADGYNLPMDVDAPYVLMHEGVGVVTWTAEAAVASYVNAEKKTVYTDSFNDAATNAYAVAAEGADARVTLYQIPAEKDTYALAGDNALVVATGTDMSTTQDLAEKWNKDAAEKLVVAAEASQKAECDFVNAIATYTLEKPVAMVNRYNADPEYFYDIELAFKCIIENPNDPLYIIPLENVEFKVNEDNLTKYEGKQIRIDNSGDKKINMVAVEIGEVWYTYSETPNTEYNYTTYTLKKAVASIPVDPTLDPYYNPTEGTKYFASVNEAVAFDPTAVVTLIAANEDGETYTLGIPGGPTTLKVVKGDFEWLTVKADGAAVVNEDTDPTDESITVYTLVEPVVAVTLNVGTEDEETKYYDSIKSAVAKNPKLVYTGNVPHLVAELVANDDVRFELKANEWIDVKGEYTNSIAVPDNTTTAHYTLDDATVVDGVTTYKCVAAEATVGNGYYTLEEAATVAGDTETITLLNSGKSTTSSYTYSLGAEGKAEKLVIYKNGQTINVTSGVEGMAVHETTSTVGGKPVSTYVLVEPVASVTVNGKTTYYDTFANAANFAGDNYTIVLLDNITTAYPLYVGNEIHVQLNTFDVPVNAAGGFDEKPAMIVKSLDDTTGVTTFNSIFAVATIDFGTAEAPDVEPYATIGGEDGAVTAAFVAEGTDPVYTVVLTGEELGDEDIFTAESKGSFLADVSAIDVEDLPDYLDHVKAAEGDYVSAEPVEGKEGIVLVSFHGAVAYRNNNQGTTKYFETIEEAIEEGSNLRFPIVLLADELSTTLEKGGTLYINKNGHDDFTVTKKYPDKYWVSGVPDEEVQYSILENKNGNVTVYTTGDGVAFVDFPETVPSGQYDVEELHNYVFYNTFADAVTAAGGVKTIVINASNAGLPEGAKYTLAVDETLIVDFKYNKNVDVAAPEGYTRVDAVEGTVHTYTVQEVVAYVWVNSVKTPYTDLSLALRAAVDAYKNNGVLELNKAPAADFKFAFNALDELSVLVNTYSFVPANFTAPEGGFVKVVDTTGEAPASYAHYKVVPAVASVTWVDAEGKTVVDIYETFAEAVTKVKAIEEAKAYNDPTKDVLNPDTVIDLLADNDATNGYAFYSSLKSLMIATNGFDPNLKPSDADSNYVEELETNVAGVNNFRDVKLVAIIDRSPSWVADNDDAARAEYTTKFSSFAEAAAKAHNKPELTVTLVAKPDVMPGTTDVRDVFEMGIGTLKVKVKDGVTGIDLTTFIKADPKQATVIPVGENVVASFAPDTIGSKTAGTFTVEGNEAMIVYPGEPVPRYFKTFEEALDVAMDKQNLAITPLTSLKKTLTGLAADNFFNVAASEYDVEFRAEDFELVAEGTDPVKYTATTAVARVDTETIDHYNDNYAPVYVQAYFAQLADASKFAANTKAITLLSDISTYALGTNGADEVLNLLDANKLSKITSAIEGMGHYHDTAADAERPDHAQVWKLAAKKTVVVYAEGGKFSDNTDVKTYSTGVPGSQVTYDNGPTRTGYTLDYLTGNDKKNYKWDSVNEYEGYERLPDKMPANGLELRSVWAANDVTVQFYDNGNPIAELKPTVKYDSKITQPTYTPAPGWHLVGWYSDLQCTKEFDFVNTAVTSAIIDTTGEKDVVKIYGKCEQDDMTVTFVTHADNHPTYTATVKFGEKVEQPTTTSWTRAGYTTVSGWKTTGEAAADWNFETPVTSNLTLDAQWTAKQMTLVWVDRSNVLRESGPVDVGSAFDPITLNPPVDVTTLSNPGYRVDPKKAWIDDLGNVYDGKVPYHETTDNKWVFKVNWIEQVDVSFIYNDEVVGGFPVDKNSALADYEDDLPKPKDATKVYTWTLKGEDYDLSTPVTATMTLVGTLADAPAVDEYTVKFESDHGDVPKAQTVKAGETAVKPADPTAEGWTFNGWFAPDEETAFDFTTPINADLTLTAKWTKESEIGEVGLNIHGAAMQLNGTILLNFYTTIPEDTTAATITMTVNGRTYDKNVDEPDRTEGDYQLFNCPVFAKEMDEIVTFKVFDAEGKQLAMKNNAGTTISEYTYTVKTYLDRAMANPNLKGIAEAMSNYGDYVAYYFKNPQGTTSLNNITPTMDVSVLDPYQAVTVTSDNYSGPVYAGGSMLLEADTTIKVWFSGSANGCTITCAGKELRPTTSGSYFYVEIPGIAAKDLDTMYEITVTNSTGTHTVSYSGLTYVRSTLTNKGNSRTLMDAVIQMYYYNQEANKIFG